jgi:hypothetical protein
MDEHRPDTDPSGAMDPPDRKPPTAVAAAGGSGSDPRARGHAVVHVAAMPNWLGRALNKTFDVLDEAADTVAEALHIRPPSA